MGFVFTRALSSMTDKIYIDAKNPKRGRLTLYFHLLNILLPLIKVLLRCMGLLWSVVPHITLLGMSQKPSWLQFQFHIWGSQARSEERINNNPILPYMLNT